MSQEERGNKRFGDIRKKLGLNLVINWLIGLIV
jgi:hypothetical protein